MKILLFLLIIINTVVLAGEEEGTGSPPNNTTSNIVVYQLVCTPVTTGESTINQQDPTVNCVLVEAPIED